MLNQVPELSVADYTRGTEAARNTFCSELLEGLQRYGFVILRDHPVSTSLLDTAYRLSAELFAQEESVKRRYVGGPRATLPFKLSVPRAIRCRTSRSSGRLALNASSPSIGA